MNRQQGVVLVVALVVLLVMTGVGITAMSGATLQERLAGNNRQLSSARLNAESALRRAEEYVFGLGINNEQDVITDFINNADSTGHFYPIVPDGAAAAVTAVGFDISERTAWPDGDSREVVGLNANLTAQNPRFIVEYIGRFSDSGSAFTIISLDQEDKFKESNDPFVFRITAIGFGPNQNIYSVLQSVYMTQQGAQ